MTLSPIVVEYINLLLTRVPELQPTYDKHIRDNDELLPHVFFGDVTRYVVQQVRSGKTDSLISVEHILRVLEQYAVSGNEYAEELIAVSFIENLVEYDDVLAGLKGLIGPNLQTMLRNYGL